ncbi:MAG TPA: peptidyl-prolyl cis-trans isomerase [Gammaproteobacteria bacterium]|nr:peptidyl-prolyl cis-trans isomerase [Gammaproteobacteria bacterium]
MSKHSTLIGILFLLLGSVVGHAADNPRVRMETSKGDVIIELYPDKAPVTVKNFLRYVHDGAYDHTVFHRVIKGFMNQGGGYTADLKKKDIKTYPPIRNEADNGLRNERGTIAMARTGDPDSATNQFFINTADNSFLDHRGKTRRGWGYAVFGRVVSGMEVMDRIARVETGGQGPFRSDVPKIPVEIYRIRLIEDGGETVIDVQQPPEAARPASDRPSATQ